MDIDTALRRLPKAELHLHLEGAVAADTVADLAARHGIELPPHEQPSDLYDYDGLADFLLVYSLVCHSIRDRDDFHRVTYECLQRCASSGARYVELFFSPESHLEVGVAYPTMLDGVLAAMADVETDLGLVANLIPAINRELGPARAVDFVEMVHEHRRDRVLGIGLDFNEDGHPSEEFVDAFRLAARHGLERTSHAGEVGPASNIRAGIELLDCSRVDHGYNIVDDPELVRRCAESQIPFTVCPTTTTYTSAYRDLSAPDHAIRQMADAGLMLTVNSDDPPMFGVDLADEYSDPAPHDGLHLRRAVPIRPQRDRRRVARRLDQGRHARRLDRRHRSRIAGELASAGPPDPGSPGPRPRSLLCWRCLTTPPPTMKGAEALAAQLVAEGVEVIFGLPGDQLMHALEALARTDIEFVVARHEQTTTFMADGYAGAGGRPGVAMVVPGCGVYNAGSGLATAYACSSPIMLLAGQVPSHGIGKDLGLLHDVHDQLDLVRPITKSAERAVRPEDVAGAIRRGFAAMNTGRPRPVEVEIPPDTLAATGPVTVLTPDDPGPTAPDPEQVERARRGARRRGAATGRHRRRYGRGGRFGRAAGSRRAAPGRRPRHPRGQGRLRRPAPAVRGHGLGQPPGATGHRRRRRGAGGRHPLPGHPAARRPAAWSRSTSTPRRSASTRRPRWRWSAMRGWPSSPCTRSSTAAASPGRRGPSRPRRSGRGSSTRSAPWDPRPPWWRPSGPACPTTGCSCATPPPSPTPATCSFPASEPRSYFSTSYMGTLGFGYPASLGVKYARPDRPVVTVAGDGGFLYAATEMATAQQHDIHTVTLVFDDGAYGNSNRDQRENYSGLEYGTLLQNPDWVTLAAAFGVDALQVDDLAKLPGAMREALAHDASTLIAVPMDRLPSIL